MDTRDLELFNRFVRLCDIHRVSFQLTCNQMLNVGVLWDIDLASPSTKMFSKHKTTFVDAINSACGHIVETFGRLAL